MVLRWSWGIWGHPAAPTPKDAAGISAGSCRALHLPNAGFCTLGAVLERGMSF